MRLILVGAVPLLIIVVIILLAIKYVPRVIDRICGSVTDDEIKARKSEMVAVKALTNLAETAHGVTSKKGGTRKKVDDDSRIVREALDAGRKARRTIDKL